MNGGFIPRHIKDRTSRTICCPRPASQWAVFRDSEELWESLFAHNSRYRTAVTLEGAEVLHLYVCERRNIKKKKKQLQWVLFRIWTKTGWDQIKSNWKAWTGQVWTSKQWKHFPKSGKKKRQKTQQLFPFHFVRQTCSGFHSCTVPSSDAVKTVTSSGLASSLVSS